MKDVRSDDPGREGLHELCRYLIEAIGAAAVSVTIIKIGHESGTADCASMTISHGLHPKDVARAIHQVAEDYMKKMASVADVEDRDGSGLTIH